MTKKIEANTLEEAYEHASKQFNCSITNLEIEVVQQPSKGFLGFGKKKAIIVAFLKETTVEIKEVIKELPQQSRAKQSDIVDELEEDFLKDERKILKETIKKAEQGEKKSVKKQEPKKKPQPIKEVETTLKHDDISDSFYHVDSIYNDIKEIEAELNEWFRQSCFKLDTIRVSKYDDKTLFIEFDGADSALLIGKEGYRYKAISYILFNWINAKYGYQIRLEIAEFLSSQESMIRHYLQPIIEKGKQEGKATTKTLDGILVQIALKELRETFPNKYVAIRSSKDGDKYIIINDFRQQK